MRSSGFATPMTPKGSPGNGLGLTLEVGGSITLAILFDTGETLGEFLGDLDLFAFRSNDPELHTESRSTSGDCIMRANLVLAWANRDEGFLESGMMAPS